MICAGVGSLTFRVLIATAPCQCPRYTVPNEPAPILGPMKMLSMGISQSSIVSFFSRLISFLLLSSALLALCLHCLTLVGLLLSLLELAWVGLVEGLTWSASLTMPGIPPAPGRAGGLYWSGRATSVRMLQTFGAELLRSRELMAGARLTGWCEPLSMCPPGMIIPTIVSGALCSPASIVCTKIFCIRTCWHSFGTFTAHF